MTSVVFVAALVGRKVISWWILLLTGWVMILVEPLLLTNVSFQLSMGASVGLMIVEPTISRKLGNSHEKLNEVLSGSGLLTSLSTMVITAPIIWWHFGRMSWIGIVSNIMILPFVPLLMIVGVFMQVLPSVFSWPTYALAHWMVRIEIFFLLLSISKS
jgi:competence protein ComEC